MDYCTIMQEDINYEEIERYFCKFERSKNGYIYDAVEKRSLFMKFYDVEIQGDLWYKFYQLIGDIVYDRFTYAHNIFWWR